MTLISLRAQFELKHPRISAARERLGRARHGVSDGLLQCWDVGSRSKRFLAPVL